MGGAAQRAVQGMLGRRKRVAAVVGSMSAVIRPGTTLDADSLTGSLRDAITLRDQVRQAHSTVAAVPGFGPVPDLLAPPARRLWSPIVSVD